MFVSIKKTLQRRQENISINTNVSTMVRQAVQSYIREMYPDAILTVSVRYDELERLVIISTPSKTLAGELTLHAQELRAHLTAHNIPVSRIIAR